MTADEVQHTQDTTVATTIMKPDEAPSTEKPLSRMEVEKMILEAKLDVARGKITLLLWLFGLLGLLLPLFLTGWNTVRSEQATTTMENRMRQLAEEYFRYPEILATVNGNPLENQLIEIVPSDANELAPWIRFENISNVSSGFTEIELYLKDDLSEYFDFGYDVDRSGYYGSLGPGYKSNEPGYDRRYVLPSPGSFFGQKHFDLSLTHERMVDKLIGRMVPAKIMIHCNLSEQVNISSQLSLWSQKP